MQNFSSQNPNSVKNLLGFIYDIPKEDNYTAKELQDIISQLGFHVEVQIIADIKKPFLNARAKFQSAAQLQLALQMIRSFKLRDHKWCRLLPFDPLLQRNVKGNQVINEKLYDPNQFLYEKLINPESALDMRMDNEMVPFPDNSSLQVNVFIKGLDKSWEVKDLHKEFCKYGEIRSAKISLCPLTHQSHGYGFIWFSNEESAKQLIKDSIDKKISYIVTAYKPREMKLFSESQTAVDTPDKTLVVYNFDELTSENELLQHFSQFGEVIQCKILSFPTNLDYQDIQMQVCLVSFSTPDIAEQVCIKVTETDFKGQVLIAEQASSSLIIQELVKNIQTNEVSENSELYGKELVLKIENIPTYIHKQSLLEELQKYGKLFNFSYLAKARKHTIEAKFSYKDNSIALRLLQQQKISCQGLMLIVIKYKVVEPQLQTKENLAPQNKYSLADSSMMYSSPLKGQSNFEPLKNKAVLSENRRLSMNSNQMLITMSDKEMNRVQQLTLINKQYEEIFKKFKIAFQFLDRTSCHQLISEFIKLKIDENNDQEFCGSEDFIGLFKANMDRYPLKQLEEWQDNFERFSILMDQLYLKSKDQYLKQ